jgi:hypothetical protein
MIYALENWSTKNYADYQLHLKYSTFQQQTEALVSTRSW